MPTPIVLMPPAADYQLRAEIFVQTLALDGERTA